MENVFTIPPHVLLEEDKIHDLHSVSHKDIEKIEQEIKDLQNQIAAVRTLFIYTLLLLCLISVYMHSVELWTLLCTPNIHAIPLNMK